MENGLSVIKTKRVKEKSIANLVDIEKAMREGKGPGYERWAKVFNVKQMAKSLLFLQEHGIKDYEELVKITESMKEEIAGHKDRISVLEEKLTANKELQTHIINYAKSDGKDEKAKVAFKKFPRGKLPKMKALRAQHEELWQQKKQAYSEYWSARKEAKDYLIARENIELMMGLKDAAKAKNDVSKDKGEI